MTKALEAAKRAHYENTKDVNAPPFDLIDPFLAAEITQDVVRIIRAYAANVTEEMVVAFEETETALVISLGEYGCKSGNHDITRNAIRAAIERGLV